MALGSVYIGNLLNYLTYLTDPFPRGVEIDLEGDSTFPPLMLSRLQLQISLIYHSWQQFIHPVIMYTGLVLHPSTWNLSGTILQLRQLSVVHISFLGIFAPLELCMHLLGVYMQHIGVYMAICSYMYIYFKQIHILNKNIHLNAPICNNFCAYIPLSM